MNEEPITKLVTYTNQLEERMEFFVTNRASIFIVENKSTVLQNNLILLEEAWEKAKKRIDELRKYLEEFKPIEELEKVGLTDYELDFKLALVNDSLIELKEVDERFSKKLEQKNDSNNRRSISQNIRRLADHWEKYFDHADTILVSLSVAGVPGADGISEIKTGVEKLLKWYKKA